jgi:hypothetical protein
MDATAPTMMIDAPTVSPVGLREPMNRAPTNAISRRRRSIAGTRNRRP